MSRRVGVYYNPRYERPPYKQVLDTWNIPYNGSDYYDLLRTRKVYHKPKAISFSNVGRKRTKHPRAVGLAFNNYRVNYGPESRDMRFVRMG
jgi:hypothetical protein